MVELPASWPTEPDLPEEDPEAVLALSLPEMINALPEPYRQVLLLTEYQGLSQKQLAENLGISLSLAQGHRSGPSRRADHCSLASGRPGGGCLVGWGHLERVCLQSSADNVVLM